MNKKKKANSDDKIVHAITKQPIELNNVDAKVDLARTNINVVFLVSV